MSGDVDLLEAWRRGDDSAGRQLFERYFSRLRRFFHNKVDGGVDDLMQATLLACVESQEKLRDDRSFRAYLFGIARYQLFAHYRARRNDPLEIDPEVLTADDLSASPTLILAKRRQDRVLLQAVRGIPLDSQIILELHYWEQITTRELGTILDVPVSTAKTRLVRARQLLQVRLDELTTSSERLETTGDNLERWAQRIRDYVDEDRAG